MKRGLDSKSDSTRGILDRGRLALEALKSREQAAMIHAARTDLQIALSEAEAGDDQPLRQWLSEYRGLIECEPELQEHLSSLEPALEFETIVNRVADPNEAPSPTQEETPSIIDSPWTRMVAAARRRAEAPDPMLVETVDEPSFVQDAVPIHQIDIPLLDDVTKPGTKKKGGASMSVIGSSLAHLVALVAMSTYMIHAARKPEPKAIVASSVDSDQVSMDAPIEMDTAEAPSLDALAASIPNMPSFASTPSSAASDVQLPASLAGLVAAESLANDNRAVEQATQSLTTNNMANSVQFFGVKATGNTFCYVVDSSPSMRSDGAFQAAKAELIRSLSMLKPKQRYYIVFFGGELERMKLDGQTESLYPVYATPENIKKTLPWIESVRIQRGLAPTNALAEVIKMDPDGIFLLFDGDTKVDVPAQLRKINRSDDLISGGTPLVPIHTIGFYNQEFEGLMKRIAAENLGSYRFVPNPKKAP